MNFLEIVQTACQELGLQAPTTLANTTDLQLVQLMALTNRDCTQLQRDYDWTELQTEFIVNVNAQQPTVGDWSPASQVITNIPSTAGLSTAFAVSGDGMPQAQRIQAVLSPTSVQLSMLPTATVIQGVLYFAQDTYALPTDFDRYIGNTWWDRTNHWRLIGPDSPQMDQYIRSGIFATGPRRRWRQLGGGPQQWRIWPPPFAGGAPAPGALVFEYISNNWAVDVSGNGISKMTADTDVPLLDAQLVVLGVKWRMWQIKGFEYAALQQEYLDAVASNFASDGGIPDLYLNRRGGPFLISNGNVQDGFYPGPGVP